MRILFLSSAAKNLYLRPLVLLSVTRECANLVCFDLAAELDKLWSCVGKKENRYWVWIVMDATTRHVIAFHVGDRSGQSAAALWEKIPPVYQSALCSTPITLPSMQ